MDYTLWAIIGPWAHQFSLPLPLSFYWAIPFFSNTGGAAVRVNQQMLFIHLCSPFF